ncbi:GlxA family transcriptional regulator [Massilia endophytica]|uniref:GlxA family transcriptional regulator n=1 Tax=Massilia endophytica TaxID=2899220 RepID=UPI001E5D1294|nr:helix-turn-helix domain-containing protein [Massilia endophytica]UGQ47952.1 DJ-1/PfpI family protein [Massilia endophytica]
MKPHRVVVLVTPQVVPFDLATPLLVFQLVPDERYVVTTCAVEKGASFAIGGMYSQVLRGLEAFEDADTIVIPGVFDWHADVDATIKTSLRAAYSRKVRIASICTGAFTLAHAGLLNQRRATTHWAAAQELADMFPEIEVDPTVLYVDGGQILTSAGVTAGIDMCLHIVRSDVGQHVANQVARLMVASPHRSGGQAQFIERPIPPGRSRHLDRTRDWILANLDKDLRVADMAEHAGLALRSFARRFESETGVSPIQWIIEQRIKLAQTLLETTTLPVEIIANRCGFPTAPALRQHFKRITKVTPTAYRRTFSDAHAEFA